MNPLTLRPMGDRLLLHKCENPEPQDDAGNVLIVLPDMTKDNTNFCQVLAAGPKCKVEWPKDAIVRVKHDYHADLVEVPDTQGEFWLAREGIVEPAVYG